MQGMETRMWVTLLIFSQCKLENIDVDLEGKMFFYYHFDCRGQESCLPTFSQDGRAWQGHAKEVNHVWLVSGALNIPDMLLTRRLHAIFSLKLSEEAQLLDFLLLLGLLCYSELIQNAHTPTLRTDRYLPGNGRVKPWK